MQVTFAVFDGKKAGDEDEVKEQDERQGYYGEEELALCDAPPCEG
jgi:hypothetical protein